jgi:hypothetical protein
VENDVKLNSYTKYHILTSVFDRELSPVIKTFARRSGFTIWDDIRYPKAPHVRVFFEKILSGLIEIEFNWRLIDSSDTQ